MEPIKYFLLPTEQLKKIVESYDKHNHNTVAMALELLELRKLADVGHAYLTTNGLCDKCKSPRNTGPSESMCCCDGI